MTRAALAWPAAVAFVAGLLLAASLPPFGWWVLAWLGAGLFAWLLHERGARHRVVIGLAAGLGLYAPGLWWMASFSAPGYVLATIVEGGLLALGMLLVPARRGRLVAFPAALTLVTALHDHWPFGGVPLGGIDLGQVDGPLAGAARLGGHLALVALVGLIGAASAAATRLLLTEGRIAPPSEQKSGWLGSAGLGQFEALLLVVAVVVAVAWGGAVAPDGSPVRTIRVAAVQGGGPRGVRAVDRDPQVVFDAQVAASDRVRTPVALVLWPEDVVDVDKVAGSPEDGVLRALAERFGATVVAGIVEDAGPDHFHNAAIAWAPGEIARYDKVHRVPFGEYIPLRSLIEHLADLSAVPRDEARAPWRPGVLATPVGRLGVVISFEVFFARRARAAIHDGRGQVLLVPTNASSFAGGQVPAQELAAARIRAIETGRWVVQAAPTGYSALVDQRGRVDARSPLGRRAVVQGTVGLRRGQTIAMRLGDGPLVLAALAALVAVLAAALASGRKLA